MKGQRARLCCSSNDVWQNAKQGVSGIGVINTLDVDHLPVG